MLKVKLSLILGSFGLLFAASPTLAAEPVIDQNFFVPKPIFTDTRPLPTPTLILSPVTSAPKTAPTAPAVYSGPFVPPPIFTDTRPLPTPGTSVSPTLPSNLPKLLQVALNAQSTLEQGVSLTAVTRKNLTQMQQPREISFVLYDTQTTEVVRVDGLFDGKSWKPVTYTSPNFPVMTVKVSGLASYTYSFPGNRYIMMAVRYPRWTEVLSAGKRIGVDEQIAIKTPYQKEFQTPDVASAGADMLNAVADAAIADLSARNVISRAQPGQKLASVADKNMLFTLYVIEHSSLAAVQANPDAAVERFLVNYAINPKTAYSNQSSHMGAQGIAQFMPATYTGLAKHTELGLIQDVQQGTSDHVNISKAAFALMDAMEADLPDSIYAAGSIRLAEAIAGSYNGGSNRVKTLIERDVWYDQIDGVLQRHQVKARSRVPTETLDYVKKLRLVLPAVKRKTQPMQI